MQPDPVHYAVHARNGQFDRRTPTITNCIKLENASIINYSIKINIRNNNIQSMLNLVTSACIVTILDIVYLRVSNRAV
jgi:hypothetical protein